MGLPLTIWILLACASGLFGAMAAGVGGGAALPLIDERVALWFHAHASAPWTRIALVVTNCHDTLPVLTAALALAVFLAWKRNGYGLIVLSLTVPLGMLLNVLLKHSFQRVRPQFADPLLVLPGYSFPSGHVAGATLFYGVVAALLVAQVAAWHWRLTIVAAALALVLLVAWTRLYLGVHYLSDVLAAFAEGVAWLALCLGATNTFWRQRAGAPGSGL